jgi:hypothetical protein
MYRLSAYLYGTVNGRVPAEALIIRTQGSSRFSRVHHLLAKTEQPWFPTHGSHFTAGEVTSERVYAQLRVDRPHEGAHAIETFGLGAGRQPFEVTVRTRDVAVRAGFGCGR